jgi:CHAT domain-containing protein
LDVNQVAANVATIRNQMLFDDVGRVQRVNVQILHDLYQRLFAPALPHLAGVQHIMVVPAGPLMSLPLSMLVASPPPEIRKDADYRNVDWLMKHYAISVLPSVSSIRAVRQFTRARTAQDPFAGFGDPLVGETRTISRGARGKVDVATVFRNRSATDARTIELADVEAIRDTPRLPETADEIRSMAKALKANPNSIWLRENATETKVKNLDLTKYRTIVFATHGLTAGEIKGIGEPGLILTPPLRATLDDDGFLSAGEIARLKLDADWVVLSACNTAAADGTPGAQGLSGLAKAFFYAGSRSLLVSHWPVASEATLPLTTTMLNEYARNPALGKADAHRKAMLALFNTANRPEYAHPIYWAPFVVVGEGGSGTAQANAAR